MTSFLSQTSTYDLHKDDVLIERYITVTGQYEGFHTYEDAPDDVAFLRNNHRHLFKWSAEIEVTHNDREIEFFMVKMFLEREVLPFVTMKANLGSCEQQAEEILKGLVNKYGPKRYYEVNVAEDGENGGTITWDAGSVFGRLSRVR